MPAIFVTHARTLDELRAEFTSDIRRRLAAIDAAQKFEKRATESAKLGARARELESLLEFWQSVELRGAKRKKEA